MKDKTFGTVVCLVLSLVCLLAIKQGEITEGDAKTTINMCDNRLKDNSLGMLKATITKIVRGGYKAQVYLQNGSCQSIVEMEYKHLKMTENVGDIIQVPVKVTGQGMYQSVGNSKLTSGVLNAEGKLKDDVSHKEINILERIPWQDNFFWLTTSDTHEDICFKFSDNQRNDLRPGRVQLTYDKTTGNILDIVRIHD